MQRMIRSIVHPMFTGLLHGCICPTAARDLCRWTPIIAASGTGYSQWRPLPESQAAIQNILRLQKEHELDLSNEFHFRYAKVSGRPGHVESGTRGCLKISGGVSDSDGPALCRGSGVDELGKIGLQRMLSRPNYRRDIITDAYLLQAEQSIRDGDHNRAKDAIQNIRNLQEQHELDLSDEFHFRYAKVADVLDMPDLALESVCEVSGGIRTRRPALS